MISYYHQKNGGGSDEAGNIYRHRIQLPQKNKRGEFLKIMDEIIPWDEWVRIIEPYYPKGRRGRPLMGIGNMLWMYLFQIGSICLTRQQKMPFMIAMLCGILPN